MIKQHWFLSLSAFICGLLFGLGLLMAGMANPAKVLGFLDIAGLWDPSLALVMVGGIVVAFIAFTLSKKMPQSLLNTKFHWPEATAITRPLLAGSALFGLGWGLVGLCPGPALVLAGTGSVEGLIFIVFMLMGMQLVDLIQRKPGQA
ncbi:MAG: YeeE/YedE family protein [Gammaproteobacteria bacterium]|nr:YeeE/YedE family protein [Gammaproteobacteria bacterium]MBU2058667.1 YeeE/YedE family protein [Gammaproteobacteria bacterium]MBU2177367.1 YeeE/YedE family protein [Gammaproteobacteria bacterium]MBU2246075.1 YeeE/YedE family protein [Gammaproteobacteria bacterium]MBU2345375.1 YeeE/YedE family protein [Gammaproteobacteria bacterium]